MTRSNEWFIDSAATKHMTNDRNALLNYVEYEQPTKIYLGDSTVIHALGEGEVRLPTVNIVRDVTHDIVLNLHKVLFVPYMLTFTDDYSRYTPLHTSSKERAKCFQNSKSMSIL